MILVSLLSIICLKKQKNEMESLTTEPIQRQLERRSAFTPLHVLPERSSIFDVVRDRRNDPEESSAGGSF